MAKKINEKKMKRVAKKVKNSLPKKARRIITSIALVCVAIFVLVCYFNPAFYNSVVNFITGKQPKDSLVVNIEGDTATVSELRDVEVYFLDVGNADCIFFVLPDGKRVLVDAGDSKTEYNESMVNFIKGKVVNDTIDLVIATHAHEDHIGGMPDIFEAFEIKKVYRPYVKYTGSKYNFSDDFNKGSIDFTCSTNIYGEFLNLISNEKYGDNNIPCEYEFFNYQSDFAMNIVCGDISTKYTFDFLTPTSIVENINYDNANNFSPFIKFEYQDFSIMLTGDAEEEVITELLNKYSDDYDYLDVDLLKVGHHGSTTSTTSELIDVLKPEHAVILCGENSYGHPSQEVLQLLNLAMVSKTSEKGTIKYAINRYGEPTWSYVN